MIPNLNHYLHSSFQIWYYKQQMLTMNDSTQQNWIGEQENGENFFTHQFRQLQFVNSQSMRQKIIQEQKGMVTIKKHQQPRWIQNWNKFDRNRYGHQKKKPIQWKEKESDILQRLEKQIKNRQDPHTEICNERPIIIPLQLQQSNKMQDNEEKHEILTQIQLKIEQRQINDHILQPISNESPSNIKQQSNLSPILMHTEQGIKEIKETSAQIIGKLELDKAEDEDLQSVMIDLNPKKNKKKSKKDRKDKKQKIILEKMNENSIQFGNNRSLQYQNEPSIIKSEKLSEKSIDLTRSINKLLSNVTQQEFYESPMREIKVQMQTNGCIDYVKIENIHILPLNKTFDVQYARNHENFVQFHQTQYEFPGKQYRTHVKQITLCSIRIPQLSISTIKNDEYYEILSGLMLKIACLKLRCTNCSRKIKIVIKNHSNQAIQSCQSCSMTLKILINSILIIQ